MSTRPLCDAYHFMAGGLQPLVGFVAGDGASRTVAESNQVWGIGQNKVDGLIRKAGHNLDTVTLDKTGHMHTPLLMGAPLWCRDHHTDGRPAEQTRVDAQAARAAGAD